MKKTLLIITLLCLLSACTAPSNYLRPEAFNVEVKFSNNTDTKGCTWLGEVYGSEGHWYSYLLFTNKAMVEGAINQMKNNAQTLGANMINMTSSAYFITSYIAYGSAYYCPDLN